MKKISVSAIMLVMCLSMLGQNQEGNICIGVVCPEQSENFSAAGLSRLSQKLIQIATKNGVATFGDGTFVMYPSIAVYDIQIVEGGMKNVTTAKVDLSLNVIQLSSKAIIGTIPITLSGSGFSLDEATNNAVSKINVQDGRYANFLSDCKKRICEYYEKNYANIIAKAKALASQQQYEAALAQLAVYPESLPSYNKVNEVAIPIYKEYQKKKAAKIITEAKTAIAVRDYDGAAILLAEVDPESPNHKECLALIESIRKYVSKERQEEIDSGMEILNSQIELEKHRNNTIKEIAKAYYSNQPNITYTQIIK